MKKTTLIFLIILIIVTTFSLCSCSFGEGDRDILPSMESSDEKASPFDIFASDLKNTNGENEKIEVTEDATNTEFETATEKPLETETSDTFARVDILLQSKVSGLHVRTEPKNSAKSLGSLDKGDNISFYGESKGWYTTFYKEKRAYVSADYCNVIEISASSKKVENVIEEGKKLLGYPYIWGSQRYHWGNGKLNTGFKQGEFDCSALMQYIFYKGDKALLGLTTREQVIQGQNIKKANIQRGDLLFFTNASRKNLKGIERVGHVGLYLGDNLILHTASDYACIEVISKARWDYFISASRI